MQMGFGLSRAVLFVMVFLIFANVGIQAATRIADLEINTGDRIAFFADEFDPIDRTQMAMIEAVIASQRYKYVVLVPFGSNPMKPRRTSTSRRLEMLQLLFKNNSRVVIPDHFDLMPIVSETNENLRVRFPGIQIAMMGSERRISSTSARSFMKLMWQPEEWLMMIENSEALDSAADRGKLDNISVSTLFFKRDAASEPSSRVRARLRRGEDWRAMEASIHPVVGDYAATYGLYRHTRLGRLARALGGACVGIIARLRNRTKRFGSH